MKKVIIKIIRKILYVILICIKFPKLKNKEYAKIDNIKNFEKTNKVQHIPNEDIEKVDLDIIVPVYNSENSLKKCLDALINQKTNYKYRVICINDGSTDSSESIINEYIKVNKNILLFTEENKGPAESRNLGIRKSNSTYISFVDSDDYVEENFVQMLLEKAYKENVDIVRCNYVEYSINNEEIIKLGKELPEKLYEDGLKEDILKYKGYPWGGVFRSKLWEDIEFPAGYWYEDMVVRMIAFRKAKRFLYINDKLYCYCIHDNNLSKIVQKSEDLKCLDQFFLTCKLSKYSEEINLPMDEALYLSVIYELSVVLWLRTRNIDENIRKQVFLKACDFIENTNYNMTLDKNEKLAESILKRRDYVSWKLYAIYRMLEVKYGV